MKNSFKYDLILSTVCIAVAGTAWHVYSRRMFRTGDRVRYRYEFSDQLRLRFCTVISGMASNKYILLNFGLVFVASVTATDLRRIFPANVTVREGEEFQIRLNRVLRDAVSCYVRTPSLVSYNLESEIFDGENRIKYWEGNGECGVRVTAVTREDAGRWRLTAKNNDETLVDSAFVRVLDKLDPARNNYSIESGLDYTLTLMENTKYCKVRQPHSKETLLISGECKVELHQPSAAVDGTWTAVAGVIGQLAEVSAEVELNVYRDELVTGVIRSNRSAATSIYCNLWEANSGLEFCTFAKSDNEQTAFQLSDGMHSGKYGYYGAGLASGECGITIESPTQEDYGQWLCTIGKRGDKTFGSFVELRSSDSRAATVEARVSSTTETTTSLGGNLQLRCIANVMISYCWFLGPDGAVYSLTPSSSEENDSYRYIGNGFGKGECGMEIKSSETRHRGRWTCHLGPDVPSFELISTVDVKISETPLAARVNELIIPTGSPLTLECRTVPDKVSLDYCRFFMPDGNGIHIGDEITQSDPIIFNGTYYWYTGDGLKLGGCGLTIGGVSPSHFGNWTCAARLQTATDNTEAFDSIVVRVTVASAAVTDPEDITAGAAFGIAAGVATLLAILAAGTAYLIKIARARQTRIDNTRMRADSASTASSGESLASADGSSDISLKEIRNPII